MRQLIIVILGVFLFASCHYDKEKTCRLSGKVIDRNSETLILKKETEDSRYNGIEIQIDSSGNFNHTMNFQFVEAYELIFKDELSKGAWRPILFFPDNNKIDFTLYPMEKNDSNKIVGSKLSLKEKAFNQKIMEKYYAKYVFWEQKIDSLISINETSSNYYNAISDSINAIGQEVSFFEFQQTVKLEINIYGYSKLVNILRTEKGRRLIPIDSLKKYSVLFQQKFSHHPYNEITQFRLDGLTNIEVGGNYVNFTAQDSIGNSLNLSKIISKNSLTLIDLWAPWCGPCIGKSKKVVPVYEEFKDKGFEVVGVVGGVSSKEQYIKAIEKYKYPWVLLAEIDDENKLWEKYCISGGGGGQFLVDNDGKILAVNPKLEELKRFIMEN